jgi:protein involved in plasmid replication-relaxation
MTEPRLSSQRLYRLAQDLSERDRSIIQTLSSNRLATAHQVELLHFTSGTTLSNVRQCQKTLKRLTELQVLIRFPRRQGGTGGGSDGYYYGLGRAGQRLGSRTTSRYLATEPLANLHVAHILAVTEFYVDCQLARRTGRMELKRYEAEPRCWRRLGSSCKVIKPDAFVIIGRGERAFAYFIEVDMASEPPILVRRKLIAYARYWASGREQAKLSAFPRVLFLVPDQNRLDQIAREIRGQPTHVRSIFAVALQTDAISTLNGGTSQ